MPNPGAAAALSALVSLLAVDFAAAEPVVPGFVVTPYATVTDRLGSRAARNKLDDALQRDFLAAGGAIMPDTERLRAQVACPNDAGT